MAFEDRNYYLVRKTIAQAMLDVGMFTQHARKLKNYVQNFSNERNVYGSVLIGLTLLSLVLQGVVGLLLAMNRHYENKEDGFGHAFTINDWLMTAVVCIICLNCFILAFDDS